jgi:hypothetical protein
MSMPSPPTTAELFRTLPNDWSEARERARTAVATAIQTALREQIQSAVSCERRPPTTFMAQCHVCEEDKLAMLDEWPADVMAGFLGFEEGEIGVTVRCAICEGNAGHVFRVMLTRRVVSVAEPDSKPEPELAVMRGDHITTPNPVLRRMIPFPMRTDQGPDGGC